MNTINYRKMIMTLGGVLIATVAAGCYGGGGSGGVYTLVPGPAAPASWRTDRARSAQDTSTGDRSRRVHSHVQFADA